MQVSYDNIARPRQVSKTWSCIFQQLPNRVHPRPRSHGQSLYLWTYPLANMRSYHLYQTRAKLGSLALTRKVDVRANPLHPLSVYVPQSVSPREGKSSSSGIHEIIGPPCFCASCDSNIVSFCNCIA